MMKMLIEFDVDKITREGKYDLDKMKAYLDAEFEKRGVIKDENGLYSNGDFASIGGMVSGLSKTDWFMENVKKWIWYDSFECASEKLDDYEAEDLIAHYSNMLVG
jgi:methionine synthase I (cobalamin-dependent)